LVAGEGGLHLGADGDGLEDAVEGGFEENIEEREHAEEVEGGGILGQGGSEQFAEAGAGKDDVNQGGGTKGQGSGDGHGDDSADRIVTDHQKGLAEGGDEGGMSLDSGVGEAEDAIAEGGVGGDEFLEFAEVGGSVTECGQKFEVDEGIVRNGARLDEDGLGKEIALEEGAAFGDGDALLDVGFYPFGEQLGLGTGGHGIDFASVLEVGGLEIDFDEVGEIQKGDTGGLRHEGVEGEAIACRPERETGGDHFGIGVDVGEDFEDGGLGRKQGDEAIDEGVASAVDEGGGVIVLGDEHQPVVDYFAGGLLWIARKGVGFAGAVEEFVTEEAAFDVENGLAAEEAVGDRVGRGMVRCGPGGCGL